MICMPAGRTGGVWMAITEAIAALVGVAVMEKQTLLSEGGSSFIRELTVRSYAAVLRGNG